MLHYRHGRPQRAPQSVEVTPEVLALIRAVAGEDVSEEDVTAFEVQLYDTQPTEVGCECFDKEMLDLIAEDLARGCTVDICATGRVWRSAQVYRCAVERIPDTEDDYRLVIGAFAPRGSYEAASLKKGSRVMADVRSTRNERVRDIVESVFTEDYPLELVDTTAEHVDLITRQREPYAEDINVSRCVIADTLGDEGVGLHDLIRLANYIKSRQLWVNREGSAKHFRMSCFASEIEPIEDADGEYRLVAYLYKEFEPSKLGMDDMGKAELMAERERIDNARKTAAERRKRHLSVDFRANPDKPFDLSEPVPEKPLRELKKRPTQDEALLATHERLRLIREQPDFGFSVCEYVEPTEEFMCKINAAAKKEADLTASEVYILRAVMGDSRHIPKPQRAQIYKKGQVVSFWEDILRQRADRYVAHNGDPVGDKHGFGRRRIRAPGGEVDITGRCFDVAYEPMRDMDGEYELVAWFFVEKDISEDTPEFARKRMEPVIRECARLEAEYHARREAAGQTE